MQPPDEREHEPLSLAYFARRVLQAIPLLLLASLLVFLLVHIAPGDPVRLMLGQEASQQQVDQVREQMGLNEPLLTQYAIYLGDVIRGDLGTSIRSQRPVTVLILEALPNTLILGGGALVLAFGIGIPLGVLAAVKQHSAFDNGALMVALLGQAVPSFWLGLMLISFVATRVSWIPTSGTGGFRYLILPVLSLAPVALGMIVRITRISVIESLREDYIRTATAKGVRRSFVIGRHAFKNALIPIVTIMGLQIGWLLSGAIITETVFAWPGIGRLAVNALMTRDYPVVQGVVLMTAFLFVALNLLVDMLYAVIDKRVQHV